MRIIIFLFLFATIYTNSQSQDSLLNKKIGVAEYNLTTEFLDTLISKSNIIINSSKISNYRLCNFIRLNEEYGFTVYNDSGVFPLQYKDIKEISFVTGSHRLRGLLIGMGVGFALGTIIDVLAFSGRDSKKTNQSLESFLSGGAVDRGFGSILVLLITTTTGIIAGSSIGGRSHTYDTYDFTKLSNNVKKEKLKKLIKKYKQD